jgi:uncharacterized protein (DUF779 family)
MGRKLGIIDDVPAYANAMERHDGRLCRLKYEVLLGAGGLMSLYDVDNPRGLLEDIQVMEATALAELNKKDG